MNLNVSSRSEMSRQTVDITVSVDFGPGVQLDVRAMHYINEQVTRWITDNLRGDVSDRFRRG